MFDRISLAPRPCPRLVRYPDGVPLPLAERPVVQPVPFGSERAEEVFVAARDKPGCGPFSDRIDKYLTDGELAYVSAVWDCMPGSSSWWDAFNAIRRGRVF